MLLVAARAGFFSAMLRSPRASSPEPRAAASCPTGRGRQYLGHGPRDRQDRCLERARPLLWARPTPRELQDWLALIHPDDRERVRPASPGLAWRGATSSTSIASLARRDERVGVHSAGESSWRRRGPRARCGVVVDVALRRWIEEQLPRSEEGFRLAQGTGGIGDLGHGPHDRELAVVVTPCDAERARLPELEADLREVPRAGSSRRPPRSRTGPSRNHSREERSSRFSTGSAATASRAGWSHAGEHHRSNGTRVRLVGVADDVTKRHAIQEPMRPEGRGLSDCRGRSGIGTWDMDLRDRGADLVGVVASALGRSAAT